MECFTFSQNCFLVDFLYFYFIYLHHIYIKIFESAIFVCI